MSKNIDVAILFYKICAFNYTLALH